MNSTSRTITGIGITNSLVETIVPTTLGVSMFVTAAPASQKFYLSSLPVNSNPDPITSWLIDYLAIYGIVRGILQMAEGAGVVYQNDKMNGGLQIAGGFAMAMVGLIYELNLTSAMSVAFLAGTFLVNSLLSAWVSHARGCKWIEDKPDITLRQQEKFFNKPDSPMGIGEYYFSKFSHLTEAVAFFGLATHNAPVLAASLVTKGVASLVPTCERITRALR